MVDYTFYIVLEIIPAPALNIFPEPLETAGMIFTRLCSSCNPTNSVKALKKSNDLHTLLEYLITSLKSLSQQ